jgi:hypothetical protein
MYRMKLPSCTLDTIEQQLWIKSNDVEKTMKSLKRINRETGFESWMETIPFPIASILWRYYAESNVRLKKELSFTFLKRTAEFQNRWKGHGGIELLSLQHEMIKVISG